MSGETAPLSLLDVLKRTTDYLKQQGCDAPRLEAELLLSKGLGIKRIDLYLQFDRPLEERELAQCRALVRRRGMREPIAYILGEKEFRSLAFEVNPDVFIPRPDTETVVDAAAAYAKNRPGDLLLADVGTGSGCLAVSMAYEIPASKLIATDISPAALATAARNAARHGVHERIQFIESAYLDKVPESLQFDAIVCNPPYVLLSELAALQPELKYEPAAALCPPGDDVNNIFVKLAAVARERLKPGGRIFIEIGESQAESAERALLDAGLELPMRARDLSGAERVVSAAAASFLSP
ncbi:MAG: peptide chain release factor N(5)-glutamine methyltransferase [Planctomycetota bacterium]